MITCVSRCKSVPDWIKSSRLWARKSQDPRFLLQPHSRFSSLNRISSRLINRGGWSSYHPLSNHNNVNSTSESALHFPRELRHMLMYACFIPCAHTQQDNCWSLSFVVYLQSGSGSAINHRLWQKSVGFMRAHEHRPEKRRNWMRHSSAWNIFPANLIGGNKLGKSKLQYSEELPCERVYSGVRQQTYTSSEL